MRNLRQQESSAKTSGKARTSTRVAPAERTPTANVDADAGLHRPSDVAPRARDRSAELNDFSSELPVRRQHRPTNMGDVVPTIDDEAHAGRQHHHPNDSAATDFPFDPRDADAAADLAAELGADFLEGATKAEDMSELCVEHESAGSEFSYFVEGALSEDDDERDEFEKAEREVAQQLRDARAVGPALVTANRKSRR